MFIFKLYIKDIFKIKMIMKKELTSSMKRQNEKRTRADEKMK